MNEKLGCPYAISNKGVVRCALYDSLGNAGLHIDQLDHTLQPNTLFLKGVGEETQCGIDSSSRRQECIGAHVPPERRQKLFAAVREHIVLVFPEQRHTWARIFSASADAFLPGQ